MIKSILGSSVRLHAAERCAAADGNGGAYLDNSNREGRSAVTIVPFW